MPAAGRYRFRHELLREVAYELQPPSWRRKVHEPARATSSPPTTPADWHVLASHYERAERHREAAAAYQQTAEWARRRGALDEARAHLTRAIDLVVAAGRAMRRATTARSELRLRRGFLAMPIEGAASADASADFDRCLELAAADPAGDDMFSTLISLWPHYVSRAASSTAPATSRPPCAASLERQARRLPPPQSRRVRDARLVRGRLRRRGRRALRLRPATGPEASEDEVVAAAWFVPNDPTVGMHVHLRAGPVHGRPTWPGRR